MKENVQIVDVSGDEVKQQNLKNICVYCRVSTDILYQKDSYEAQLEYYKNMIRRKKGWNFVGIYVDYSSGTNEKCRNDFMQMLKDCEIGIIDIICTKSISRFARNTVECIQVLRKLKEMRIDVYFEKELCVLKNVERYSLPIDL